MNILKDKRGWSARDWVVVVIVFSALVAFGFLLVTDMATTYNNPDMIDTSFSDRYDKLSENTENIEEMYEAATTEEGLKVVGTLTLLFKSFTTIASIIITSPLVVAEQVATFGTDFGIPREVTFILFTMLLAIITGTLVLIIIASITQRKL
jgi:hypothetical protein